MTATPSEPAHAAPSFPKAAECDILLLLEGTYPFVSGGVSSWVHQIIRGFPGVRFGLVFIGSRAQDYGPMKYQLPSNVVHLETHYVHEPPPAHRIDPQTKSPQSRAVMEKMHDYFRAARATGRDEGAGEGERLGPEVLHAALRQLHARGLMSESQFLYGESSWEHTARQYRKFCTDPSFIDYFWTIRIMHAPIWVLARAAEQMIPARLYHTVSTGYAGFLGALLKLRTGKPLLVSEHGIYTKERKIDLFQGEWIRDNRNVFERDAGEVAYFRDLWIRFFEALGRMCYDQADRITALFEQNRLRQVADGADPARTLAIPNGVNVARFVPLRAKRPADVPLVLCLIGRVVPIKDIETFIRAMRSVVNRFPYAQGWIAGPEDEDPKYAHDCKILAAGLGLKDRVKFLGFQKIDDLMPQIGLVVLSSISEGLPLVMLEGFAAGVPSVATDVGSCRQLIHGLDQEDQKLGRAGRVVRIADPEGLANACLELLGSASAWRAAQTAAISRVERYYRQEQMFDSFRQLYDEALGQKPARAAPTKAGRGAAAASPAPVAKVAAKAAAS